MAEKYYYPHTIPAETLEATAAAVVKTRRNFEAFLNSTVVRKESSGIVALPAASTVGGAAIPTAVGGLTDVTDTLPANRHVLVHNGAGQYVNRVLVRADVSDIAGETSWTAPTLLNSWVNFGNGVQSPSGYRKNGAGVVTLRGLIKDGSSASAIMFTLPAGYRPPFEMSFPTEGDGATDPVIIRVEADGDVYAIRSGVVTGTFLDGISFYV